MPNPANKGSHIAECLREITSIGSDAPPSLEEVLKRRCRREQTEPSKTDLPLSLQNVLGKLTAADAAIVKAAFQAKEAEASRKSGAARAPNVANVTEENTLHSNLQKLGSIDSKRVFMVRKIGKLGFNSPEVLKTYFSKFGTIEEVLVSHSIDKRNVDPDDPQATPEVRPAGIGFIVMANADDVVSIFQHGLVHQVLGVDISLTAYEHHDPTKVMRNESKYGVQPSDNVNRQRGPRFPTYANITEDNTMKANLQKMATLDAARIFMVRRINKLGLGSAQLLKTHFEQFGGVTHVFVTHSIDRRSRIDQPEPNTRPQVKPAGIGFIVMDRPEEVAAIFRHGLEHIVYGVKICVATYEHQIPAEAATHANSSLSANAIDPDKRVKELVERGVALTTVIDACAKAGDMVRAEFWMQRLLDEGAQPDVVSYCAMIDACAKSGDAKKACKWHEKMQSNGIQPNAHSFSAVINACAKAVDLPLACQWIEEMGKAGVAADVVIYANVLDACAKVKNGELARLVFDQMIACGIRPNIVVFTSLARSFAHSGNWQEVERIAEEMLAHKVAMNEYFLYVLLIAYSQAKPQREADRAEAAFLQATRNGIKMNKHIMVALERAVGSTHSQNLARKCGMDG